MSRHRKFIKSEKTKTKLKGNKLAKGLNVTKTDFKIKKIIIREQIKDTTLIEDGAEIRSQNIKVSKKIETDGRTQLPNCWISPEFARHCWSNWTITMRPAETRDFAI